MIYLPHPKFDFEDVDVINGGILGVCYPSPPSARWHFLPVNAETVINRFPKAISLYWCKNKTQSVTLGFVREDGAEFAIRFLKSTVFAPHGFGEIIGYWKDIVWPEEPMTSRSPRISVNIQGYDIETVEKKREYDRQEYAKFVKWLARESK